MEAIWIVVLLVFAVFHMHEYKIINKIFNIITGAQLTTAYVRSKDSNHTSLGILNQYNPILLLLLKVNKPKLLTVHNDTSVYMKYVISK